MTVYDSEASTGANVFIGMTKPRISQGGVSKGDLPVGEAVNWLQGEKKHKNSFLVSVFKH